MPLNYKGCLRSLRSPVISIVTPKNNLSIKKNIKIKKKTITQAVRKIKNKLLKRKNIKEAKAIIHLKNIEATAIKKKITKK